MNSRRLIYSTERGSVCSVCGWPEKDCRCSSRNDAPAEKVPAKIAARLRIEHRGPGKTVTLIEGLPRNRRFLEDVTRALKKSCGSGGRAGEEAIELQGDQRERVREILAAKGWRVKG